MQTHQLLSGTRPPPPDPARNRPPDATRRALGAPPPRARDAHAVRRPLRPGTTPEPWADGLTAQCTGSYGHDWPSWAAPVAWSFFVRVGGLPRRPENLTLHSQTARWPRCTEGPRVVSEVYPLLHLSHASAGRGVGAIPTPLSAFGEAAFAIPLPLVAAGLSFANPPVSPICRTPLFPYLTLYSLYLTLYSFL